MYVLWVEILSEEANFSVKNDKTKMTASDNPCCVSLSFCCFVLLCLVFVSISWSDLFTYYEVLVMKFNHIYMYYHVNIICTCTCSVYMLL